MDATGNLNLPFIVAAQAQKHVTHNEALRALDAIVQLSVLDKDLTAPPGSPAESDRYIVPASATGAWAGHDGNIAAWQDGAWAFYAPREGWLAWAADEDRLYAWTGTAWTPLPAGQVAVSSGVYPPLSTERTTSSANTPVSAQRLLATTSGDMADGFGVILGFSIRDNAGVLNEGIATVRAVRSGVDNSGRLQLTTLNAGIEAVGHEIAPSGNNYFPNIGTTASAANAVLNSGSTPSNELLRSTSSRRYKREIEDVQDHYADNILSLRPVWYKSGISTDRADWSHYGLIAEEVAEVDPRLVHWGYRDEDWEMIQRIEGDSLLTERRLKAGAQLVPDGVAYERLTVLLLNLIKRQQAAIAIIMTKIDNIDNIDNVS
jgi:hypothetical protein